MSPPILLPGYQRRLEYPRLTFKHFTFNILFPGYQPRLEYPRSNILRLIQMLVPIREHGLQISLSQDQGTEIVTCLYVLAFIGDSVD